MNQGKKIITVLAVLLLVLVLAGRANSATVHRSSFLVGNLSCTSCVQTITNKLKTMPGTLGVDADFGASRVTVDHLSALNYGQIATVISNLGYPATLDWTATIPEQNTRRFYPQKSGSVACSGGGCTIAGGTGANPAAWKDAPPGGTVNRTTLQVSNLSCSSCLANIAAELQKIPGTYGMNGYLSRGIVIVDHSDALDNNIIAAAISKLGYPARILALNEIPVQKAFCTNSETAASAPSATTSSCYSKGPCNATAASWIKLYNRYFSQTNTQ